MKIRRRTKTGWLLFIIFLYIFFKKENESKDSEEYKFIEISYEEELIKEYSTIIFSKNFINNHNWMFNYNVIQYSSYIIVHKENKLQVEAMIYIQLFKLVSENIKCLVLSTVLNRIYILNLSNVYKTKQPDIRKIVCSISSKVIPVIKKDGIRIAIVNLNDFNFNILQDFGKYPLDMISYQIPSFIYVEEPRLPQVGVCLQYVYEFHPRLSDWIELHKKFKVAKIIMYDGTLNFSMKSLNNNFNEKFLKIHENFYPSNYCNNDNNVIEFYLKRFPQYKKYLESCKKISNKLMQKSNYGNEKRNQMSSNDCYLQLNYIYEFVSLYDSDELIIPRYYENSNIFHSDQAFNCTNHNKEICFLKPISLNMYDYIRRLIQNSFTHEISKLRSIEFQHAVMFTSSNLQKRIMQEIKLIAIDIENNNLTEQFPIEIPTIYKGVVFTIAENELSHVVRLSKLYDSFNCLYGKYLEIMRKIDQSFVRYLYFVTGNNRRLPKSIHYTKNVYSIFTHDALHYNETSIILKAPIYNGHINAHFRDELISLFEKPENVSVKSIDFDFEYAFYLLKTYSNFCTYD